ncbi:hypothetical protein [Nostoc piscinale]|uniref:hypothetical protein n=1 Tax=Nostoc piscinale TaxID=224012 RepID=UPI000AE61D76|nr:hypothetical protein [Nostoc piscinale]
MSVFANSYAAVILSDRVRYALHRINQQISSAALQATIRQLTTLSSTNLIENNLHFHKLFFL